MPVCYGAGSALELLPSSALSSVRIVFIGPTLTLSRHHNQRPDTTIPGGASL
jgi:hypothetical protein